MGQQIRQLTLAWGEAGEAQRSLGEGARPPTAPDRAETLAQELMEEVVERENLWQALKRVRSNTGGAGVAGMTTDGLLAYLREAWPRLKEELLAGTYRPQPVKRVAIPKPDGGVRALGIPVLSAAEGWWIGSSSRRSCKG
jgi:RNA-directed DNA polymerase